jgi:putative membrane protein
MQKTLIISIILATILVIFALQNVEVIPVNLWFWSVESSLALILLISFGIGAILGVVLSIPSINKRKKKLEERKKEIEKLQAELGSLKSGPTVKKDEKENPENHDQ